MISPKDLRFARIFKTKMETPAGATQNIPRRLGRNISQIQRYLYRKRRNLSVVAFPYLFVLAGPDSV